MDELEPYLDELIAEIIAEQGERQLRRENPHALFLIKVLKDYGARGLHRKYVMDKVYRMEKDAGFPISEVYKDYASFEGTIQRTFQTYSSQAAGFKGKPEDDIFFFPQGKGQGQMAVYGHKIKAFLEKRGLRGQTAELAQNGYIQSN